MQKKALIEKKLEETGEKARLEEYLRQRLIESGWKENLKKHCLGKSFVHFDLSHLQATKFDHSKTIVILVAPFINANSIR